jgi:hypothetical protein
MGVVSGDVGLLRVQTVIARVGISAQGATVHCDAIPVEACYLGWQQSLRNLARLVEPEINQ